MGLVIPGNFINEKESNDLRKFLLKNIKITHLLQFENRKMHGEGKFFPEVHPQFKILILLAEKHLPYDKNTPFQSGEIKTCFLQNSEAILYQESKWIDYSVKLLRELSQDELMFFEFQSRIDIEIINKIYDIFPPIRERTRHNWRIGIKVGEIDMRAYRDIFNEVEQEGDLILYEGKMIEQYRSALTFPRYFINPNDARNINKLKLHNDSYVWEYHRIAIRRISGSTNARTLIATILPKDSLVSNSMNAEDLNVELSPKQKLFSVAYFNTFLCDYITRFSTSENVKLSTINSLPFPSLPPTDPRFQKIAKLSAKLICYRPEFSELAEEIGFDWQKEGLPLSRKRDRLYTRAEIDVIFARDIFGLTYQEYDHILNSVKTKGGRSKLKKDMDTIKNRALELWNNDG